MTRDRDESDWSVVMTVDEPPALVLANVAWHLEAGARAVHVYLDRPGDPVETLLAGRDGVHVTVCDAAWWRDHGHRGARPASQMRRQSINANRALARTGAGWLLHLDADEFLWQHRPLVRELRHLGPLECEVSVPVVERFFRAEGAERSIFDGGFRRSTRRRTDFDAALFGADFPYLSKGLPGHSQGKAIVPAGGDFQLGIHWAFRGPKRGAENRARQYGSRAATLLHFDGLTPLHFVLKLARYAMQGQAMLDKIVSGHRRAQVAALLEAGGTLADMMAFHDRLKRLTPGAEARLGDLGLIADIAFTGGAGPLWPAAADLSIAAFDAELTARYPEVMAFLDDPKPVGP